MIKKLPIKCIVCKKTIPYTVYSRKFCRGGDCRTLFNKLKKHWKKNDLQLLSKKELKLCKKLANNGLFKDSHSNTRPKQNYNMWKF